MHPCVGWHVSRDPWRLKVTWLLATLAMALWSSSYIKFIFKQEVARWTTEPFNKSELLIKNDKSSVKESSMVRDRTDWGWIEVVCFVVSNFNTLEAPTEKLTTSTSCLEVGNQQDLIYLQDLNPLKASHTYKMCRVPLPPPTCRFPLQLLCVPIPPVCDWAALMQRFIRRSQDQSCGHWVLLCLLETKILFPFFLLFFHASPSILLLLELVSSCFVLTYVSSE